VWHPRRKAGTRSRTRKAAVRRALPAFLSERFAQVSGELKSRLGLRLNRTRAVRAGKPPFLQGL